MTKYKIGDRVRVVSVDETNHRSYHLPLGAEGVVTEINELSGRACVESGGLPQYVDDEHIELITDPAPLRFSDVRTGDTITVKVEGDEHSPTITFSDGIAEVNEFTGEVRIQGLTEWVWNDETTPDAKLIAHTPAEPEWHRAKVIKANVAGRPTELLFWVEARKAWATADLLGWPKDAPTNVTIIVDAEGRVRA